MAGAVSLGVRLSTSRFGANAAYGYGITFAYNSNGFAFGKFQEVFGGTGALVSSGSASFFDEVLVGDPSGLNGQSNSTDVSAGEGFLSFGGGASTSQDKDGNTVVSSQSSFGIGTGARQSMPSSSMATCAGVSGVAAPPSTVGQRKRPLSSRLANRQ